MLIASGIVEKLSWIDRVVSYVWIFLSLLMFSSLYLIYEKSGINNDSLLVVVLLIATWTYPLYTFGFKLVPGLFGNLFYAALLLYVVIHLHEKFPLAAWLLIPIGIWIAVATIYVLAQIIHKNV
jgi:tryptophan-rich sensory protein